MNADLRDRLTEATDSLHAIGPAPLQEISRRATRLRRTHRARRVIASGTAVVAVSSLAVAALWPSPEADTSAAAEQVDGRGVTSEDNHADSVPPSPEQLAALNDGTVTQDEYQAGFDRFDACMKREGGFGVEIVRVVSDIIRFERRATPANDKAFALCYPAEFEQIDARWQITH